MGAKKIVWCAAAAMLLQGRGAWATTLPCSSDGPPQVRSSASSGRTMTDPATGATISLDRESSGRMIIELRNGDVSVRREFNLGASTTTLARGNERVILSLKGNDLRVTQSGEVTQGTLSAPDTLVKLVEIVRQSPAAQAARDLLNRVALHPDSVEGNALLLTKALLGSVWGETKGTLEYQRWAGEKVKPPTVIRARFGTGPGDCWNEYAAEAIRVINDYGDCGNTCGWSGYFCGS